MNGPEAVLTIGTALVSAAGVGIGDMALVSSTASIGDSFRLLIGPSSSLKRDSCSSSTSISSTTSRLLAGEDPGLATNRPSSFLKKDKMLPLGLPFGLKLLLGAGFLVLVFPFANVDIFGCFEPLELLGGIVLVAISGGLVVGIAGGGLLNGVVELDGDGGLPTDGRTCVPDDTV